MLVEQKQMFAPAEISRSWMSVADDAAVYQSGAKFPHLIVVHLLSGGYRGQLDRVATLFVRCRLLYWSVYRDSRGHVAEISVRSCTCFRLIS